MKTLNVTYENRHFKQMLKAKKLAEKDLGKRISWDQFIYGRILS